MLSASVSVSRFQFSSKHLFCLLHSINLPYCFTFTTISVCSSQYYWVLLVLTVCLLFSTLFSFCSLLLWPFFKRVLGGLRYQISIETMWLKKNVCSINTQYIQRQFFSPISIVSAAHSITKLNCELTIKHLRAKLSIHELYTLLFN